MQEEEEGIERRRVLEQGPLAARKPPRDRRGLTSEAAAATETAVWSTLPLAQLTASHHVGRGSANVGGNHLCAGKARRAPGSN